MRRNLSTRGEGRAVMEGLEPRLLLAGNLVISEFMADNTRTLKAQDGQYYDWIEICNMGATAVNLGGYYLTDSSANLMKWQFPSTPLAGGGYLVVFASDKNIAVPGQELHTNFKLAAGGEYLALVEPDGHTIASQYSPQFPQQYPDLSYGVGQTFATKYLVGADAQAAVYVPANGNLGSTWTARDFDDSGWTLRGTNGVGFEVPGPGFAVHHYLANLPVTNLATAESVISTPGNRAAPTDGYAENVATINYLNSGLDGNFQGGRSLPGAAGFLTNDVMEIVGTITITQPGLYTFGVSSDDGFRLTIAGATTAWKYNSTTSGTGDSVIDFDGTRTAADTWGVFNFPAAGSYPVRLVWFQNTASSEVEFFGAKGDYEDHAFNGSIYKLVGDAALTQATGLAVQSLTSLVGGGLGYYTGLIHTDARGAMYQANASAYIRLAFDVADPGQYNSLTLLVKYDDGFVAYLNGTEVARRNAPGTPAYNSSATASHAVGDAVKDEEIDISSRLNLLRAGTNVLAIQGLNLTAGDGDFLVQAQLVDRDIVLDGQYHYFSPATPGSVNFSATVAFVADTKFDHDRGFYDSAFDLKITTATVGATIRYTTDGSAPTATTGTIYTGPVRIAKTTVLRVAAFETGFQPTNVDTQTYIFVNDVIAQPNNPTGFPASWGGTPADYGMDPDIVNSPTYAAEVRDNLKAIPTMSLVLKIDDMFGATGIYSNPYSAGEAWERAASLELIYPNGTEGFQVDGGIRIYGGVGRDPSAKKHTFRFFFNDNLYGPKDLNFKLFDDTRVDQFDSIILRSQFNDGWGPMSWGAQSQFARDLWANRTANAMGVLAPHGNYVHLYINGLYWGLYNPLERPDHHFAASYFGGASDDYDVIHGGGPTSGMSVVNGTWDAWNAMMAAADGNLAAAAVYQNFQQIVDVASLADYCMLNFYTENWDWDDHNWYAARDRNGGQWHFFPWDTEWILPSDLYSPNMIGTDRGNRPSHVFQRLRQNLDFRMLFADRVYKQCYNGGPLSPAGAAATYVQVANEIYPALADESARWGDMVHEPPYARNTDWTAERNRLVNIYFPARTGIFIGQLRSATLYPNTDPPVWSQHGGSIDPGFLLTMSNPNATGTIYYTLDGSDPRLPGGAISPAARVYSGAITLTDSTLVRSRVLKGTEWSAMHEAAFVTKIPPPLRITELMYHPGPPPTNSNLSAEDFEFVEVKNIGTKPLNIGGFRLDYAVSFTFPSMTLDPGGFALVVSNRAAFISRYGTGTVNIAGEYQDGRLNNDGDRVILLGKFGETILDFTFKDGWYPITDGQGYSLNIVDATSATSTWGDKFHWAPSNYMGGSPGGENLGLLPGSVAVNELLAHTNTDLRGDWVELKNTTADPIDISGWWLSDDKDNLQKYQIPGGTVLQAGQYFLLTQRDNFGPTAPDPGRKQGFGFGEYGGTVCLTGVDEHGLLTGYREQQDFDASDREFAFTRYVTSTRDADFVMETSPTPGTANNPPLVGGVVVGGVTYSPGVILNEVMYHPVGDADEFVELKNCTNVAVPLYDPAYPDDTWQIGGGLTYVFPKGLSIPANGYLLVVSGDPAAFRTKYAVPAEVQILGPYFGFLDNGGENIKLYRPGEPDPLPPYRVPYYLVDRVEYGNQTPWPAGPNGQGPSLERLSAPTYGNDPAGWFVGPDEGTPGRASGPTDVTPPRLVKVWTTDGDPDHVNVQFNEAVDPVSSQATANYTVTGLTVSSVSAGPDSSTVVLNVSTMANASTYPLTISHVKNAAGVEIAAVNQGTFSYFRRGAGLWGQYFTYILAGGPNWNTRKAFRLDATVNFDWATSGPGDSSKPGYSPFYYNGSFTAQDAFCVRWTGQVKAQYSEDYTFYATHDDGVRVWLSGVLIIDNWTDRPYNGPAVKNSSEPITLHAGDKYDIKIEYYEKQGNASMQLSWSSASVPEQAIPTNLLYSNISTPPTAVVDNYLTAMNPGGSSPIRLTVPAGQGVLANDSDPSGYALTAAVVSQPSHGSVTLNADGSFTYTPTAGYSGPDSFRYLADDSYSTSSTAGTVVNIQVNLPPVVTGVYVNAAQYGTGLQGDYYQYGDGGVDWATLKLSRLDSELKFDWGTGSPDPALAADKFSIRWTGKIQADFTETHTFYTQTAGGVRLWVNNQLLIDHWTAHAATEDSGTITLIAGKRYDIKIEYYKDTGPGAISLLWSSPNMSKQPIGVESLFGPQPLRTVSGIDPTGQGIQAVTINFSKAVTFAADDVLLQQVTFSGNVETVLGTVAPLDVYGYNLDFMTITLPPGAVMDSWLKVTLKGSGTIKGARDLKLGLDGEPKSASGGGSGAPFIYDGSTDLPTGNGVEGGDAVFYIASLRGDFNGDGQVTADDVGGFFTKFLAGSRDADFRGPGFADTTSDGKVTASDVDGFIALYQTAVVEGRHLAPLPSTGPLSAGAPEPLAAMPPSAAPPAAPTTPAALEVDALALAPEIAAAGPPAQPVAAATPAAPTTPAAALAPLTSPTFETILTVDPAVTAGVPLASAGSGETAPASSDPLLVPDGGVDLLALQPIELAFAQAN